MVRTRPFPWAFFQSYDVHLVNEKCLLLQHRIPIQSIDTLAHGGTWNRAQVDEGGHDASVSHQLLDDRDVAAAADEVDSKRVAQLVDVELYA